jgi:hypothetical protein
MARSPRCSVGCEPVKRLTVMTGVGIDVDGELANNTFGDRKTRACR